MVECQLLEYLLFSSIVFQPYCPTFDSPFETMVFGLCHGTRQHWRTDSLEKRPNSFGAGSIFATSCAGDCVADFMPIRRFGVLTQ